MWHERLNVSVVPRFEMPLQEHVQAIQARPRALVCADQIAAMLSVENGWAAVIVDVAPQALTSR